MIQSFVQPALHAYIYVVENGLSEFSMERYIRIKRFYLSVLGDTDFLLGSESKELTVF
jgi:hypothetical protein